MLLEEAEELGGGSILGGVSLVGGDVGLSVDRGIGSDILLDGHGSVGSELDGGVSRDVGSSVQRISDIGDNRDVKSHVTSSVGGDLAVGTGGGDEILDGFDEVLEAAEVLFRHTEESQHNEE